MSNSINSDQSAVGALGRSSETALILENVSVEFGGLRAVDGVTFRVEQDQIVSIVGPNGAGKTTLLNAICGAVPKTGLVRLAGKDVSASHSVEIVQAGIGRSFQDPQLLENETVLENLLCGMHGTIGYGFFDQVFRRRKVARLEAVAAEQAHHLLNLVDIPDILYSPASELAYGTRKIVDIIRATIGNPAVLLLDEPTSGLDHGERKQVEQLMLRIHSELGIAMLVVEHHMDLVRNISDRVVGLVAGGVAAFGTPTDVLDSEEFRAQLMGITNIGNT